jgi:hypothetical protein
MSVKCGQDAFNPVTHVLTAASNPYQSMHAVTKVETVFIKLVQLHGEFVLRVKVQSGSSFRFSLCNHYVSYS